MLKILKIVIIFLFSGDAFFSFDMGNYMELANKIKNIPPEKEVLKNRQGYLKKNNISEVIKLYLKRLNK